ncbi:hypothetical protein Q9L58_008678 [Maublancomyces gigas]|uniref:Uncharacterized protein n=1 Tax=Discina gigas TaxID=1032678 RepID=A0ABR3G9H6_9PEZI
MSPTPAVSNMEQGESSAIEMRRSQRQAAKEATAKPHEEQTEIVPRPRSSRAPSSAPFVITRENALELRAKYGVKNLAKQLMDQYKTKRERYTAVVDTMALVAEQTEVLDEMISHFWEEYMVKEQLWQGQGGEKAAKIVVDFEGVVVPAQAKCQNKEKRMQSARKTIAKKWGDDWETKFDPIEYRLRDFSQHTLRIVAALAKDGWPMALVWKAMDAGYRFRIQNRSSGSKKDTCFMRKDVDMAKGWLEEAEKRKSGIKEEVGHADLEATWPKVVRSKPGAVGMSKPLNRGGKCTAQEPEEGEEPDEEPEEEEGLVQHGQDEEGRLAESQGPEKEVGLAELAQGPDEEGGLLPGSEEEGESVHGQEKGLAELVEGPEKVGLAELGQGLDEFVPGPGGEVELVDSMHGQREGPDEEGLLGLVDSVEERLAESQGPEEGGEEGVVWEAMEAMEAREANMGLQQREETPVNGSIWALVPWQAPIFDRQNMFVRFSSQEAWERFSVDGNCIVPAFKWLVQSAVMKSVSDEFDMYLHHNHSQSDPTGELRIDHSVLEQAICQDPIYYALLVAARPDPNHHQLSVSCSRYVLSGENCQYRQINLDVQKPLDHIRLNNIQSSVSFDQEIPEGCTAVVLGFQNHLADWLARAVARENAQPGNTCEKVQEDEESFGKEFHHVCAPGDLQISLPHLVHGSTADHTATAVLQRRTVGLLADIRGDSLLKMAERKKRSRFPSTQHLSGVWGVGDAILGLTDWSSPRVRFELNTLFGPDDAASRVLVNEVRHKLEIAMVHAYEVQVWAETTDFGEHSFFKLRKLEHKEALRQQGNAVEAFGSDVITRSEELENANDMEEVTQ